MATVDPILEITDGTTIISLINNTTGFGLVDWTPKIAELKGGGTFVSSSLSDGRRLSLVKHSNVMETFNLRVRASGQDAAADHLRDLRQLLEKSRLYWVTDWTDEPVWLKAQGPHETNPRYATIHNWSTPQDDNPFAMPFFDCGSVLADEFTLIIEREPFWSNQPPGSDTAIELSVIDTYDGRTVGNVDDTGTREPTTAEEVFFTNKHNIAQLTDIYEDDGSVFSSNLLDASLPHRLFPSNVVSGDAIYFGIDTSVSDSGPFSSLIFDVGTAVAGVTVAWEYWNGSWNAFILAGAGRNIVDQTSGFTNTGVNPVWIPHRSDWATTTVNGVTGYWIRARATNSGGTGGTQQNRDIYTVNWPYIEVQNDQIGGDVAALTRLRIVNSSDDVDERTGLSTDRITYGTRSVDRGEDFSAYIPLSDTQQPSGFTYTLFGGNVSYQADMINSATGRVIQVDFPSSASLSLRTYLTMDNTIADQYMGLFRVFLRVSPTGSGSFDHTEWYFKIIAESYVNRWETPMRTPSSSETLYPQLIDFGLIKLPPSGILPGDVPEEITLEVWVGTDDSTGNFDMNLYDIILLPADEYIGTYGVWPQASDPGPNLYDGNYLEINSTLYPKHEVYSPVKIISTGDTQALWWIVSAEPARINRGARTRMWFLNEDPHTLGFGSKFGKSFYGLSAQLFAKRQYYAAIGDTA